MREMGLFTIYDVKAELHFPPFAAENSADAMRSFQDILEDPQSRLNKHVGDYQLWRLARYRVDTGIIYPLQEREMLCDGAVLFKPTMVAPDLVKADELYEAGYKKTKEG